MLTCNTRCALLLGVSSHCRKGLEAVQVQLTPRQGVRQGSVVLVHVSSSPSSCGVHGDFHADHAWAAHGSFGCSLCAMHCRWLPSARAADTMPT